eukprot:scaffold11869_cov30-Tisochrysis_lutea.AAC.1
MGTAIITLGCRHAPAATAKHEARGARGATQIGPELNNGQAWLTWAEPGKRSAAVRHPCVG